MLEWRGFLGVAAGVVGMAEVFGGDRARMLEWPRVFGLFQAEARRAGSTACRGCSRLSRLCSASARPWFGCCAGLSRVFLACFSGPSRVFLTCFSLVTRWWSTVQSHVWLFERLFLIRLFSGVVKGAKVPAWSRRRVGNFLLSVATSLGFQRSSEY